MKAIVILFAFSIYFVVNGQENCPILPTPVEYHSNSEFLEISLTTNCNLKEIPQTIAHYFEREFKRITRGTLIESGSEVGILFKKVSNEHDDEYAIFIDDGIEIQYSSEASCLYAVQSFLQLITDSDGHAKVEKCMLRDYPRFSWRGLHLDVSRHFFSVDEVKRFLDLMAIYKFNSFHWHLTDDQGWRIEIKKYPLLTEVGAYRDSTVIGHYSDSPRKYEQRKYGGFYTQEEIKEVVDYAGSLYINVIPEIEMPGHSRAALAAYPQYSCTGEEQPVPGLWGVFDDIYCSKEETIVFMQDVLSEVLELFPSEYIHIGGDEAPKVRWKNCNDCKAVMLENDLADEHELQSYFIHRMDKFLTKHGRRLIGWDEILEGGLSPNAAVMSWRGEQGGIEAAKQGHYVVMSPTTYCYFDYYQSSHDAEPLAIGGFLPLDKAYRYSPIPKNMPDDAVPFVLGGQANLWTEYIADFEHLEYMAYPRAIALSQGLWCSEKPSYEEFLTTYLNHHESLLQHNKVNYARSIHYPKLLIERADEGIQIGFSGAVRESKFHLELPSKLSDTKTKIIDGNDRIFIPRGEGLYQGGYSFALSNEELKDTFNYYIDGTSDLGIPIDLVTQPHPKFNNNGSLNLVDGIQGDLPWKGSEWLGFREPIIEMIADLEKIRIVHAVQLGFLKDNGSWIYLPKNIEIYVSNDQKKWENVFMEAIEPNANSDHQYSFFFASETRYLKIVIHAIDKIPEGWDGAGTVPWTFIDELEILYPDEWK